MKSNITTNSILPQISVWLSLQVNLLLSRIPQRVVSVCLLQLLLCIQMLPLVLHKCNSKCFTSLLVVRLTILPRHASPMTLEPIPSLPSSCRSFCCTSKSCPSAPSVRRLPPRRPGFETRHATIISIQTSFAIFTLMPAELLPFSLAYMMHLCMEI